MASQTAHHGPQQQDRRLSYTASQKSSSASSVLAHPDEDWTKMSDLAERRRIQNRIAQRNYRKKLKSRFVVAGRKRDSNADLAEPVQTPNSTTRRTGRSSDGPRIDAGQTFRTLCCEMPPPPGNLSPIVWPLDDTLYEFGLQDEAYTSPTATSPSSDCVAETDCASWPSNVQHVLETYMGISPQSGNMTSLMLAPPSNTRSDPSQLEQTLTEDHRYALVTSDTNLSALGSQIPARQTKMSRYSPFKLTVSFLVLTPEDDLTPADSSTFYDVIHVQLNQ